ncbi:MAG: FliM/FliN family flagellar motor switch protein [Acidobacteriota bacterium]
MDTLKPAARSREYLDLWARLISESLGRLAGAKVTAETIAGEESAGAASEDDETGVCVRFAAGSAGEQSFLLKQRDARRLAQLASGGTTGGDAAPRLDGQRTVEGLFSGIASRIPVADWLGFDAALEVSGDERSEWASAVQAAFRFSTPRGPLLVLEARISPELAAALEPAQDSKATERENPPELASAREPTQASQPIGRESPPEITSAPEPAQASQPIERESPPELASALGPAQGSETTESENPPAVVPGVFRAAPETVRDSRLELLMDVELEVVLRFGQREMLLRDVLHLTPGTVLELDQQVQDPVELLVGNKVVAWGEVVAIDGNYGLRITSLASRKERLESIRK